MRILHLLASPGWTGPCEIAAQLALAQRELGHEVSFAVDRKRPGPTSEEPAVPRLRALGLLDESGLELSVKSSPMGILRDLRTLRRLQLDVVHSHFTHDHLLARLARPPHAVLVRSLHAPRSVRRSLPRADAYTIAFDGMRPETRAPVITLPAPVDGRFAPAPSPLPRPHTPLIGMASTFQPSRRHALALDAFAQLATQRPDAHLVLLGDGVLEPQLRARASQPDLQGRVTFTGYVGGDDYLRWLQTIDELWVLGLGNDWSARLAAQGRACGARVVAVNEGALPLWADALVDTPSAEAIVRASLSGTRRDAQVHRPEDLARQVLALYADAGARG